MKKLLFGLCLLLFNNNMFAEYTIEKTGFYGVYVKSMPFWTFWNYNKVINAIAENTQTSLKSVQTTIDLGMPVLSTWDYQKALHLKKVAQQFNGELEIREMRFTCEDEEDANQLLIQSKLVQLTSKLTNLTSENTDLDSARDLMIKLLENELSQESEK